MKKIFSLSLFTTKLGLLFCFCLMGTSLGAEMVSAEVPPCHHEMAKDIEQKTKTCSVCELAEEVWSQDFTVATEALFISKDERDTITIVSEDLFNQEPVAQEFLFIPDPPDSIAVLHSHLVFQKKIVLVI